MNVFYNVFELRNVVRIHITSESQFHQFMPFASRVCVKITFAVLQTVLFSSMVQTVIFYSMLNTVSFSSMMQTLSSLSMWVTKQAWLFPAFVGKLNNTHMLV